MASGFLTKGKKQLHGGRRVFLTNGAGKLCIHRPKKSELQPKPHILYENHLKIEYRFNCKIENYKTF